MYMPSPESAFFSHTPSFIHIYSQPRADRSHSHNQTEPVPPWTPRLSSSCSQLRSHFKLWNVLFAMWWQRLSQYHAWDVRSSRRAMWGRGYCPLAQVHVPEATGFKRPLWLSNRVGDAPSWGSLHYCEFHHMNMNQNTPLRSTLSPSDREMSPKIDCIWELIYSTSPPQLAAAASLWTKRWHLFVGKSACHSNPCLYFPSY